jgi:hypothetical protein
MEVASRNEGLVQKVRKTDNMNKNHMVVSPDRHIYNSQGVYEWSPERSKHAWDKARAELKEALPNAEKLVLMVGIPGAGKSTWLDSHAESGVVYFDATLTGDRARAEFTTLAHGMRKIVEVVWLDTPVEVCLKRNSERPMDRRVPERSITELANKLRKFPPSYREGFLRITRVV